jgi:uncharacterized protein YozE (UPF0346 family)
LAIFLFNAPNVQKIAQLAKFGEIWRNLAKFGENLAKFGEIWQNLAKFGENLPKFGRIWSHCLKRL